MAVYWIPLAYALSATVQAVCFIVAVIMINAQAEGTARKRGLLGLLLLFLSTLLGALNGSVGPWITIRYQTSVDVYGVGSVVVTVLGAAGVMSLVLAAVAGRKAALARGVR
jgi:hypothetical protein